VTASESVSNSIGAPSRAADARAARTNAAGAVPDRRFRFAGCPRSAVIADLAPSTAWPTPGSPARSGQVPGPPGFDAMAARYDDGDDPTDRRLISTGIDQPAPLAAVLRPPIDETWRSFPAGDTFRSASTDRTIRYAPPPPAP
jgi:hypothetical protein